MEQFPTEKQVRTAADIGKNNLAWQQYKKEHPQPKWSPQGHPFIQHMSTGDIPSEDKRPEQQ